MTDTSQASATTWRPFKEKWLLFGKNLQQLVKPKSSKPESKHGSAFYTNSRKPESKGTLVCTPQGYGIIQELRSPFPIKLSSTGEIKEFQPSEIFLDIPISITFISSGFRGEEKLTIPVTSSPKDIVSRIEGSFTSHENIINVQVFFKGRDLSLKSSSTLEKLGIFPDARFVAIPETGTPFTICRYQNTYNGWGYSDRCINAMAFSVNKSVKIRGFGIYIAENRASFSTGARFMLGSDETGQILTQSEFTVTPTDNADDKVYRYFFDRPIRVLPGEVYSCVQEAIGNYNCCTFYGDKGMSEVAGEKDVIFSFEECYQQVNNTNRNCGQLPEIYYFA